MTKKAWLVLLVLICATVAATFVGCGTKGDSNVSVRGVTSKAAAATTEFPVESVSITGAVEPAELKITGEELERARKSGECAAFAPLIFSAAADLPALNVALTASAKGIEAEVAGLEGGGTLLAAEKVSIDPGTAGNATIQMKQAYFRGDPYKKNARFLMKLYRLRENERQELGCVAISTNPVASAPALSEQGFSRSDEFDFGTSRMPYFHAGVLQLFNPNQVHMKVSLSGSIEHRALRGPYQICFVAPRVTATSDAMVCRPNIGQEFVLDPGETVGIVLFGGTGYDARTGAVRFSNAGFTVRWSVTATVLGGINQVFHPESRQLAL